MKLWLIEANSVSWDDHVGFVIRAETETEARAIAQSEAFGGNNMAFGDPEQSSCREITADGEPGVILDSFNAG